MSYLSKSCVGRLRSEHQAEARAAIGPEYDGGSRRPLDGGGSPPSAQGCRGPRRSGSWSQMAHATFGSVT